MNKLVRITQCIAVAATLAGTAHASGLIGQRYFGASLGSVFWDNDVPLDNGFGFDLSYNNPLTKSTDLTLKYEYLSSNGKTAGIDDVTGQAISFGATFYQEVQNGKAYIMPALAWVHTKSDGTSNDWLWSIEGGYEITLSPTGSLTPYIAFTDGFNNDIDSSFSYGVRAAYDLSNEWTVVVDLGGDDDSNWTASGGFAYRF